MKQAFFWLFFAFSAFAQAQNENFERLFSELKTAMAAGDLKKFQPLADSLDRAASAETDFEKAADAFKTIALAKRSINQRNAISSAAEKAKNLYEKSVGQNHLKYIETLSILGEACTKRFEAECAASNFKLAQQLVEKNGFENTEENAVLKTEWGAMHVDLSQFSKAEQLFLEAASIFKTNGLTQKDSYAYLLAHLINLYQNTGNFEAALPMADESLRIAENSAGKKSMKYAGALITKGNMLGMAERSEQAKPLLDEAYEIWQAFDGENPNRYRTLVAYGNFYKSIGELEKSALMYRMGMESVTKATGKGSVDWALMAHNFANLFLTMGKLDSAETLLHEVIDIRQKALGPCHFRLGRSFMSLSEVFAAKNDWDRAAENWLLSMEIFNKIILQSTSYSNMQELEQLMSFYKTQINWGYFLNPKKDNPKMSRSAFDNCLNYKGFLLENALALEQAFRKGDSTSTLLNDWKNLQKAIGAEFNKPAAAQTALPGLLAESQEKEKAIARKLGGFEQRRRSINWAQVQNSLRPDEAAVEFLVFELEGQKPTCAALILRPDDAAPRFLTLFETERLADLMKNAKGSNFLKINDLYAQKDLFELIWRPILPHLEGVKKVFCSPAGLLHQINLGAILVSEKKTFSDLFSLSILGSTRQLVVDYRPETAASNEAYLAGGIRYSMDSTAIALANRSRSRGFAEADELTFLADNDRGETWDYLPETAREVLEIGDLLKKSGISTRLDTGFVATEETFRSLGQDGPSPRILHVSTHGFFFPDPASRAKSRVGQEPVFKISEHPMIRSGLILAGGGHAWQGKKTPDGLQDGVLTAYEISQMNLAATELVVLSACETGLGDVVGTEGVFGLQRAFKIAGAKYLIMSLWKVNDQTTRELMTEFYARWLDQKMAIPDAFRAAQAAMRRKYPDAPFHWAGFVLAE